MLLNELIKDEKKIDKTLYSSGPYWNYKNSRTIIEIKKKGLGDFRGISSGIGSSFADNVILDTRNEYNIKGRIIGKIFSLPILNKIFDDQLNVTRTHINRFINYQAIAYKNNENVQNLLAKYQFKNTTDFGCIQLFEHLNRKYSCIYMEMANRINNLCETFNFKNIKSFF